MFTAAIFDLDGTLLDSVDAHAHAWQDAFADFGHHSDFAAIRSQIGKGGDQLLPMFLSEQERDATGERIEHHRGALFKARYLAGIAAFPKVPDLIRHIRGAGLRIALATSAKAEDLDTYTQIAGITDLLDATASSADAERSKPYPDIFQAAMDRLGSPDPASVIAVGDSPYDAQAAGALGIRTIGLLCGGFAEADLRKAGCVAICRDPADLLAQFDSVLPRY